MDLETLKIIGGVIVTTVTLLGLPKIIEKIVQARIDMKAKKEDNVVQVGSEIKEMLTAQLTDLKTTHEVFLKQCRDREVHYEEVIQSLREEIEKLKTFETEIQLRFNASTQALKVALNIIKELEPDSAALIESLIEK